MLELRPNCEACQCKLPPDSDQAMICSYECTFCRDCVNGPLAGVCPNCGGELMRRPRRAVSSDQQATQPTDSDR
jgi:uncharacterized protein